MAVPRSVWSAVRRVWRLRREPPAPSTDPALVVHAAAPPDAEPLSDHERRALDAWHRAPSRTVTAEEAKRRLLSGNEAGEAGVG